MVCVCVCVCVLRVYLKKKMCVCVYDTYLPTFQNSKSVGALRGNYGGEGLEGCDFGNQVSKLCYLVALCRNLKKKYMTGFIYLFIKKQK